MPRIARLVVPNYPHHVTQRGNFFCKADYQRYISLLAESIQETGAEIWAYCLMPNHVHLVVVPKTEDGLRATLSQAHRIYSRHINLRYDWRGHLWQERFHSFLMDERYLLATVRYVERNPVVAGLCESAEEWQWSSAGAHLRAKDDSLVSVQPMLDRIRDWRGYLSVDANPSDADAIKASSRSGRPLGGVGFIEQLEILSGRELQPRRSGRKPMLIDSVE